MHSVYLPFTEDQLKPHFAKVRQNKICQSTSEKHIQYFKQVFKIIKDVLKDIIERENPFLN